MQVRTGEKELTRIRQKNTEEKMVMDTRGWQSTKQNSQDTDPHSDKDSIYKLREREKWANKVKETHLD